MQQRDVVPATLIASALALFAVVAIIAVVVGCEPSPPPKYKAGEIVQLKLTGERVVIIAPWGDRYLCHTSAPSDNPAFLHKRVYVYEAEVEPVREDPP